jgi:hypothetical protein
MNKFEYDNFSVAIDTREQQPWSFPHRPSVVKKLDTGDYTVEGLEKTLCIERKKSVGEFAINVIEPRFKDVITRMSQYKYSFLLLEFDLTHIINYPLGSNLPKHMWNKVKVTPKFLQKHLLEMQIYNNIKVIFCGNTSNATEIADYIMRKIHYIELVKNEI